MIEVYQIIEGINRVAHLVLEQSIINKFIAYFNGMFAPLTQIPKLSLSNIYLPF